MNLVAPGRWRKADRPRQGGASGQDTDHHPGRSFRRERRPGNALCADAADHHGHARQGREASR